MKRFQKISDFSSLLAWCNIVVRLRSILSITRSTANANKESVSQITDGCNQLTSAQVACGLEYQDLSSLLHRQEYQSIKHTQTSSVLV